MRFKFGDFVFSWKDSVLECGSAGPPLSSFLSKFILLAVASAPAFCGPAFLACSFKFSSDMS